MMAIIKRKALSIGLQVICDTRSLKPSTCQAGFGGWIGWLVPLISEKKNMTELIKIMNIMAEI